jgi:hypothetical protein
MKRFAFFLFAVLPLVMTALSGCGGDQKTAPAVKNAPPPPKGGPAPASAE